MSKMYILHILVIVEEKVCLGVNFINVKRTNFSYERHFSSYVLALSKNSYKKFARFTLMKLTVGPTLPERLSQRNLEVIFFDPDYLPPHSHRDIKSALVQSYLEDEFCHSCDDSMNYLDDTLK